MQRLPHGDLGEHQRPLTPRRQDQHLGGGPPLRELLRGHSAMPRHNGAKCGIALDGQQQCASRRVWGAPVLFPVTQRLDGSRRATAQNRGRCGIAASEIADRVMRDEKISEFERARTFRETFPRALMFLLCDW